MAIMLKINSNVIAATANAYILRRRFLRVVRTVNHLSTTSAILVVLLGGL